MCQRIVIEFEEPENLALNLERLRFATEAAARSRVVSTDKYARARAAERDPHIDPAHVRRTEQRLARTNSPTKKKPLVVLNPYAVDRLTRSLPDFFGGAPPSPPGAGAAASIRRQTTIAEAERKIAMFIEKKPAHQIMSETFRYHEGSRILRELGYKGCGKDWRSPEQQVFGNGPQSFEAAMKDHRAHFRMQQLYFEKIEKHVRRAGEQLAERVRSVTESFGRIAQRTQMQSLIAASEQAREEDDRDEAWSEMAEDHERRALLGEVL